MVRCGVAGRLGAHSAGLTDRLAVALELAVRRAAPRMRGRDSVQVRCREGRMKRMKAGRTERAFASLSQTLPSPFYHLHYTIPPLMQVLQGLALMRQPWAALAPATRDALAVAVYRQVQGMPPPPPPPP